MILSQEVLNTMPSLTDTPTNTQTMLKIIRRQSYVTLRELSSKLNEIDHLKRLWTIGILSDYEHGRTNHLSDTEMQQLYQDGIAAVIGRDGKRRITAMHCCLARICQSIELE